MLKQWWNKTYGDLPVYAEGLPDDDSDGHSDDGRRLTSLESVLASNGRQPFPLFDVDGGASLWIVYNEGKFQRAPALDRRDTSRAPDPFTRVMVSELLGRCNVGLKTAADNFNKLLEQCAWNVTCSPHENQDERHVTVRVTPAPRKNGAQTGEWSMQFHVYVHQTDPGARRHDRNNLVKYQSTLVTLAGIQGLFRVAGTHEVRQTPVQEPLV